MIYGDDLMTLEKFTVLVIGLADAGTAPLQRLALGPFLSDFFVMYPSIGAPVPDPVLYMYRVVGRG